MHKWSSNLVGRGANFSHANLNGNYETEKCHKMLVKKSKHISIKKVARTSILSKSHGKTLYKKMLHACIWYLLNYKKRYLHILPFSKIEVSI